MPVGATPVTLLTYTGPASNDAVTIGIKQSIGSTEPLRTGSYRKTLTFTLSTTTPKAITGAVATSGRGGLAV
jgi:hypothetical protein